MGKLPPSGGCENDETYRHCRAILALSAALALPAQAQDAGTVVATVNGTEITLGHVIALREQLPPQYQSLPDDVLYKGLLDQLIQQTALEQAVGEPSLRDRLALENDRRGYLSGVALQSVVQAAVTEEALQAAYDARFKDAAPQMEYNAAHILVESEEKANELKAADRRWRRFCRTGESQFDRCRLGREWRRSGMVRQGHDGAAL
jgi:peptidyl-prolyl cis-trans isomerase C